MRTPLSTVVHYIYSCTWYPCTGILPVYGKNPVVLQATYGVRVRVRVQALTCTCGSGPTFTCTSGLQIVRSQALVFDPSGQSVFWHFLSTACKTTRSITHYAFKDLASYHCCYLFILSNSIKYPEGKLVRGLLGSG